MKYSIEILSENGSVDYITLDGRNESEHIARVQREALAHPDAQVCLAFDRKSDGQHGYINPHGADPVGKSW